MFSRPVAQFQVSYLIAIACAFVCVISANESEAQQSGRSPFVIKAPVVKKTGYGQKPSAIIFAPISHLQEKDDTKPREDDGSDDELDAPEPKEDMEDLEGMEDVDDEKDLDDMEDLLDDEDDLLLDDEEDEDDFDSKPPEAPMTTWNLKPMTSITPGIRPVSGKSPADQSWQLTNRGSMPIVNSSKLFAWTAPNITHQPLYFEDVSLERYGQTRGLIKQPFVSGLHFLKSAAFLPYYSLYDPINSCDGPLGYCRPGDSVNCVANKHFFGNPFSGQQR